MARRSESIFASFALLLLLSLTLLYGCRAYDPEPPIINRAPQTYVIGAPAETTGTRFTRHMYWYGTDVDGEVVQYIYAITDSTVRDLTDPAGRDEEDDRFNPALDITTIETTDERFVGWTTKTDSIFQFTVDRGATSSKDITFHIVAVDDRGAMDPSPARLYFFNNSLGNPKVSFHLSVDVGTGGDPVWEERWSGDYGDADAASPEQTSFPFVGYERRFKVEWEASSPNGPIVGYRFRAQQGLGEFWPPLLGGDKQWSADSTEVVFNNLVDPDPSLGPDCSDDGTGCDPAQVRFPSGNYNMTVEALDIALVENESGTGDLNFGVNYAPETRLVFDSSYPRYEVRDASDFLLASGAVSDGDTIPAHSTLFFQSDGYDKFASTLPPGVPLDSLCCDVPLNFDPTLNPGDPGFVSEVEYQSRLVTTRRVAEAPVGRVLSNTFSIPEPGDTISVWVGPLDYVYESRTVDEHRRPDISPASLSFIGGFPPRVREDLTIPGGDVVGQPGDRADSLVVNLFGDPFLNDNEFNFSVAQGIRKWFVVDTETDCGGRLVDYVDGEAGPAGGTLQFGVEVSVPLKFVGEQDARDPLSPVAAWSFAIFSNRDPLNTIEEGLESRDLSRFVDSPVPNEWQFGPSEAIKFWAPFGIVSASTKDDYAPDSTLELERSIGCLVARRLGEMTLRLRGRTTTNAEEYTFYSETRKAAEGDPADRTSVEIGEFGRQSPETDLRFWFFLGGSDPLNPGVPAYFWPDF